MSISLRKHAAMFLAATFTVGSMATFGAAALDQPTAVLSSTLNHSVGTVLTSPRFHAQQAMAKAKASALKAQMLPRRRRRKLLRRLRFQRPLKKQLRRKPRSRPLQPAPAYNQLVASAATARPVAYSNVSGKRCHQGKCHCAWHHKLTSTIRALNATAIWH
ncbi:MAG: hypothetical protein ACLT4C_09525 [Butyricicoccus sp.]